MPISSKRWKHLPVHTKARLRDSTSVHITMLDQSAERVMSYFQDWPVKYAAYDFIVPEHNSD